MGVLEDFNLVKVAAFLLLEGQCKACKEWETAAVGEVPARTFIQLRAEAQLWNQSIVPKMNVSYQVLNITRCQEVQRKHHL